MFNHSEIKTEPIIQNINVKLEHFMKRCIRFLRVIKTGFKK